MHEGLYILFDSGSSDSMIKMKYVKHLKLHKMHKPIRYETTAGPYISRLQCKVPFTLAEFSSSSVINHKFQVDEESTAGDIGYDAIFGRNILSELGLIMDFDDKIMSWNGNVVPMRSLENESPSKKELRALLIESREPESTREATNRVVKILDANYKKADLTEIVQGADQLNQTEKKQLFELLSKYEDLFDGTLGCWETNPVKLEMKEGEKPHNSRYYPMPKIHKETFRKELQRLVEIGVLEPIEGSEWGSPTFIIPKSQGTVRFVSDFRRLNAKIVRKPYPLPRIADTLQQMEGFQYATTLDMNMGYYHLSLDRESSEMCTIVTEFGKFRYKRLPMGVSCAPDIFQSKMNGLLGDIEGVRAYLDDILILSKSNYTDHLVQVEQVFDRMQKAGLKINAGKSHFGINEVEYLGYVVTREGIKPNPKKVKAIMELKRPTTTTEVRRVIGLVQYYRDLWQKRSHILAPLTDLSKGPKHKKIEWKDEHEQAFKALKLMVSKEVILAYPDWTKPFVIHTDASDFQLGAVISQNDKPIAFFSRKLNSAQRNYTTTEKELLSIVECLKEFRNILWGYEIIVYSDHRNLVQAATISESQRVMRWRLLLEEFGPDIRHIAGEDNTIADALSRMPTTNIQDSTRSSSTEEDHESLNEMFYQEKEQSNDTGFPLELSEVQRIQNKELKQRNSKLKAEVKDKNSRYNIQELEGLDIVMYENKIYVPEPLRGRTLHWYHHYLSHPGGDRLAQTLSTICYWKGLQNQSKMFCKKCETCQKFKKRKTRYGHLPPKNIGVLKPWEKVHIDLIGPYSVLALQQRPGQKREMTELSLTAMTFIDPATGWFEIVEVPTIDKSSARISQLFDQVWLSRYPRPKEVIFDNGSEFKSDFVPLLKDFKIKPKLTSIKNPQSNAIVERVHQVLSNMFRTKDLSKRIFDYVNPWNDILSSVAWAIRASYHSTLQATPAQLVFQRDMVFNIATIVDWRAITINKQRQVDKDNLRENRKRVDYDYQVGDQIYVLRDGIHRKLEGPHQGPYPITHIYTNGTVRIQKGNVNERLNIRRITPKFP